MARIRTIKPEFWTDEKTGTLSPLAQVLFIGIMNHCDDVGVIKYSIPELSARILPYLANSREESRRVIEGELLPAGLLKLFKLSPGHADDTPAQYLYVSGFRRHQRVDKPGKPMIKEWSKDDDLYSFQKKNADRVSILAVERAGGDEEPSQNIRESSASPREYSCAERNGREWKRKDLKPPLSDFAEKGPPGDGVNNEDLILDSPPGKPPDKPPTKKHAAARFDDFWDEYPRREDRKTAREVWTRKNLDKIADQIIDDVKRRKAFHGKWAIEGVIPHAKTYLRGERWHDEIIQTSVRNNTNTDRATGRPFGNFEADDDPGVATFDECGRLIS